jgi:hypothetical protein
MIKNINMFHLTTKHPYSHSGLEFKSQPSPLQILSKISVSIPQALQSSAAIVSQIMPWLLFLLPRSYQYTIHYQHTIQHYRVWTTATIVK